MDACDEYLVESVSSAKSEALQSHEPESWFAALSQIDSYAPMIAYLVRSMEHGGQLGHTLLDQMMDNAVLYLQEGVEASRDPMGRARFLARNNAGGFLLYLRRHRTPGDTAAVLRDYSRDMVAPALKRIRQGLLADAAMVEELLERIGNDAS